MIVERKVLLDAVQRAIDTQGRRSTIHILGGVAINHDGETTTVSATDMQQAGHLVVWPTDAVSRLRTCAPAVQLRDALKAMTCKLVMFDQCAGMLEDDSDGLLFLVDAEHTDTAPVVPIEPLVLDDFPVVPDLSAVEAAIDVPLAHFLHLVEAITPAASTDESRPVMTQVELQLNGGLKAAATNSYILFRGSWDVKPLMDGTIHVGAKLLRLVAKHAKRANPASVLIEAGPVRNDTWVRIHVPGVGRYLYRSFDGQFPKVDQLWPAGFEREWTLEPMAELLPRVKQAMVAQTTKTHPLHLGTGYITHNGYPLNDDLWLASDNGNVQVRAGGGRRDAERVEWGVNGEFLRDAIKAVGDGAKLHYITPLRPFVVKGVQGVECLLMPVRLSGDVIGRPGQDEVEQKPAPPAEPAPEPVPDNPPHRELRKAVTGAVEAGKAEPVVEKPAKRRVVVATQRHVDAAPVKAEPVKPKRPAKPSTDEQLYKRVERLRKQGATYGEAFAAVAETEATLRAAQVAARYYRMRRKLA